MQRLENQVIVITGARSIGAHLGQKFAAEGAKCIAFLDIDDQALAKAIAMVDDVGGKAVGYHTDVTDADAVKTTIEKLHADTQAIDVLVNHAGGAYPKAGIENVHNLSELDAATWDASIALNLNAPYYCVAAVLPYMQKQQQGAILHIGSVNGDFALGFPAYSAGKSGLHSLNRYLAVEKGRYNIRSNILSPASIKTEAWDLRIAKSPDVLKTVEAYYPLGHIVDYDDVNNAAVFLLSAEAKSITGIELVLDAGLLAGSASMIEELTQSTL